MKNTVEQVQLEEITKSLLYIEDNLIILRNNLLRIGIEIEAISVENWPKFTADSVEFKLWNGNNHICSANGIGDPRLTVQDMIDAATRRQILRRKF